METAIVCLTICVVLETLALVAFVPLLLWRVLKHDQQLDELDQVVEAIVEANRSKR
jgi:hypothetical protein